MEVKKLRAMAIILTAIATCSEGVVKCPVVWQSLGVGEPVPPTAVPFLESSAAKDFIIKAAPSPLSATKVVGALLDDKSYVPHVANSSIASPSFFQILTNPHGCNLEWLTDLNQNSYPVPLDKNKIGDGFVGRGLVIVSSASAYYYISGTVNQCVPHSNGSSTCQITMPMSEIDGKPVVSKDDYQILHSNSPGLHLEVKRMKIVNQAVEPPQKSILGVDRIINSSPATVRQSVRHESMVKEERKIVTSQTSSWDLAITVNITASIDLKADMNIPGLVGSSQNSSSGDGKNVSGTRSYSSKFGHEFPMYNLEETDKSEIRSLSETFMGMNKEIEVPPYSSVQACSTITVQKFTASYTAEGVYTAPGLSASEIKHVLGKSGRSGFRSRGKSVLTDETGTFSGTVVVNSNFFVMLLDDEEVACHSVV